MTKAKPTLTKSRDLGSACAGAIRAKRATGKAGFHYYFAIYAYNIGCECWATELAIRELKARFEGLFLGISKLSLSSIKSLRTN